MAGRYDDDGRWIEEAPAPRPARPRQLRPVDERAQDRNPGVRRQAREELRGGRYDDDGNPIPEPAPSLAETAIDAGRSFVTGLQRGVAGLVGSAGDARDIAGGIAEAGAETGGMDRGAAQGLGTAVRAISERIASGPVPAPRPAATSAEVNTLIQDMAGPQHEPETTAGEYARTVGEFAPGVVAPGGPASRVSRAVVPAVASETAGQLTEGTDAEGPARFVAALVAGGINEGLINVLTRRGLTADERGVRLIMRELEDQGMSSDEIVSQANRLLRQAPTEEVLAETLGAGGLRLARAVANIGRGAGRSIANEALDVRAQGRAPQRASGGNPRQPRVTSIRDRILDEATRMTAPQQTRSPRNYWDALDALRTARAGQGTEAYRVAHAAAPDPEAVQNQLLPYMREAPREASASGARQLGSDADRIRADIATLQTRMRRNPPTGQAQIDADNQLAALQRDLDDILVARNQLGGIASGQAPNTLNVRAIDYFQRGLRQMQRAAGEGSPEAGALRDARRAFNNMADEIVPEFADARTRYGESSRIEGYMNNGRRVFEMSEGEIDRLMRGNGGAGLSMEEFDGFMLGVLDAIENKLGQGDTAFLARLTRNQNWRQQLTAAVGGENEARRFLNRLAREANMQQTRNYTLRGSQTTPIAEDIEALTQGEQELAFLSDNARQLIASGGQLRPLAIRWALGVFDRFNRPGLRDPAVQEALARRLFTRVTRDSSQELRDAINALRQEPSLKPEVRRWIARMTAVNAAGVDERVEDIGPQGLAQDYLQSRQAAEEIGAGAN